MEKLTRDVLVVMSKEELQDAVEALQLKLEVLEREKEELKEFAEIGKKYLEYLRTEAGKLVRLVEGEKSSLLKLIEKADIDTLKALVDEYSEKAKAMYKASAKPYTQEEEKELTPELLKQADYKTLLKLKEKFITL